MPRCPPPLLPHSEPDGRSGAARLHEAWHELRREHHRVYRRCRARPTPERIHTLRILSRQLLALITLMQALSPRPELKHARRKLRELLRVTGAARDAHVQERLMRDLAGRNRASALLACLRRFRKESRRAAEELPDLLRSPDRALRRVRPREYLPGRPADAGRQLRQAARRVLRRARTLARVRLRRAAPHETARMHRARVALKKFRYLRETILGATDRTLAAAQSALGDLHDFDLLQQRLNEYAATNPAFALWLHRRSAPWRRRRHTLARACRQLAAINLPPSARLGRGHGPHAGALRKTSGDPVSGLRCIPSKCGP